MSSIRVRIAPSPTGNLHIGTARAALFNYLYAKHNDGTFILRIEDTDLERSDKKYEQNIFDGLRSLGIIPDEGPEEGGAYGPYRQTERIASYEKYIQKMLADDTAFYCFHSKEALDAEKESQMKVKNPLIHNCEWKNITHEEAEKKRTSGEASIIRFNVSKYRDPESSDAQITFRDLIRGQVHFFTKLLGDFSLAKSPEIPLYNFAVVIDDYEMEITHVIRGEDHIANTPKQLLIAWALGWASTNDAGDMEARWKYAHLPLILGPDRSKLSKRHGATSVDDYRQQGYLPEALFNFMALLGWSPGDDREILSKDELIRAFSLEHVQHSGAVFDFQKLDWMNGEYIRKKSPAELVRLCKPYLEALLTAPHIQHTDKLENVDMLHAGVDDAYVEKILALEQPRLKKLSEIGERVDYFFRRPAYDKEMLRWKQMTDEDIAASLMRSETVVSSLGNSISKSDIEKAFLDEIGEGDKGSLLWPLRVALSGKKASPGPFEIMEILGKEESLSRIRAALQKMQ